MEGEGSGGGRRLLSTVLDGRAPPDRETVDRAVELLVEGNDPAKVAASWALGVAARDAPEVALPTVPAVAAALEDPESRPHAERALAHFARYRPQAVERALESLEDERLRELARTAVWGSGAPRTVVSVPDEEAEDAGRMGSVPGGDRWERGDGSGDGTAEEPTGVRRRRPPSSTPAESAPIGGSLEAFDPVRSIRSNEPVEVLKALYTAPDGTTGAATLKRFRLSPTEAFRSAFEYRLSLWSEIADHEAVLPVLAWGTQPGGWLATEHVVGGDALGLGAELSPVAAGWTLSKVADALSYAHAQGVIHGCVTPGRIALSPVIGEPAAWPFPRLTDWGVANLLRVHDRAAAAVPTAFAAPEIVEPDRFGGIDDATDVYQFGATAYGVFAGRPPFDDATSVLDREPPSLSAAVPAVPEALDVVLRKCLSTRKAERYETVQAMRAEFLAALGDG